MKTTQKSTEKRKKIMFSFCSENAREVSLLGDFNEWNPNSHPMKKTANGEWQKALMLKSGTYEYKFKVDGEWRMDDKNTLTCDNCFGTKNNFVLI